MTKIRNQQAPSNSGDVCPVCKGTTWNNWFEPVPYDSVPFRFGRRCPQCQNRTRGKDITGVPREFHDADLRKFRFDAYQVDTSKFQAVITSVFRDYAEWSTAGKGLYLWSKTVGSGKTFLACCLAKSIMLRYDAQTRFVTAVDYLGKVGDSYNRERGETDGSQIYRECQLLVFDDLGAQKGGDWQDQELFKIINERQSNGRITIYTANMPPENLKVSNRTQSRIEKSSIVLQMPEENLRRKKAREEQDRFLGKILKQEVDDGKNISG